MTTQFRDRTDAGQQLAAKLMPYANQPNVLILALPRGRKRERLEQWYQSVVETIDCIPWDATISQRWAALVVELKRKGKIVPLLDGMIAATALQHDLIVATRNTHDFQKTGVKTVNPFSDSPTNRARNS